MAEPQTAKSEVETTVDEVEPIANAMIRVSTPNLKKKALSVKALDSYTRELAMGTHITVDGKLLLCSGFKHLDNGNLQIEVLDSCFEIVAAT